MALSLSDPLTLPCGAVLENRLVKAAMSEGMATVENHSSAMLETLYTSWAEAGFGLLLSGNVAVDRWHLERPLNIVIEDESGLDELKRLAQAGRKNGAHFWLQLSHTGRQVNSAINSSPLAPSSVEIDTMRVTGLNFSKPKAMSEAEIKNVIRQFTFAAGQAKAAGFSGVELHGAHGYLISQFLSPLTNLRNDQWGGSVGNRARFLLEVIQSVRAEVGPKFPIGLKLNSSDFQKGGFTHADCLAVVKLLNRTTLDLIELSGGTLEQPKVAGLTFKDEGEDKNKSSTEMREAYFVELASSIREIATMPILVTGGFRSVEGMIGSLNQGKLDLVGLARPLLSDPKIATKILAGAIEHLPEPEAQLVMLEKLAWFNVQLERFGEGLQADLGMTGPDSLAKFMKVEKKNYGALLIYRLKSDFSFKLLFHILRMMVFQAR